MMEQLKLTLVTLYVLQTHSWCATGLKVYWSEYIKREISNVSESNPDNPHHLRYVF